LLTAFRNCPTAAARGCQRCVVLFPGAAAGAVAGTVTDPETDSVAGKETVTVTGSVSGSVTVPVSVCATAFWSRLLIVPAHWRTFPATRRVWSTARADGTAVGVSGTG